ncbi:RES family NAD+ phosphorylase [Chiayiivirga flava]|uniref:RES domain-containing protein n=1 Tax=Chiayiivirga flava TaxID=659595 RepID=A0A7W8D4K1_9GAMM|nr:RES family NAD+ phosphorylase [Chiayiivirga flava]MBB5206567.1 hypothetical protein [Chiayiivirga flava]
MGLLDSTVDFHGAVYRNITSVRVSIDPFDDLVPDAAARQVAIAADMRVRRGAPGVIHRGLAYSEAIDYPFRADTVVASRFGDGTHRVWYGALDEDTATAETCYHQVRMLREVDGIDRPVVRYRKVYAVRAQGLFLDLRAKATAYPDVLADDYAFCQAVGKRVAHEGLPGLLYASARRRGGECLAAFRADALSDARALYCLTYRIDAVAGEVAVERTPGVVSARYLFDAGRLVDTAA